MFGVVTCVPRECTVYAVAYRTVPDRPDGRADGDATGTAQRKTRHPLSCRCIPTNLPSRRVPRLLVYATAVLHSILLYLEEAASATWPPEGVTSDEADEENGEQDGEET